MTFNKNFTRTLIAASLLAAAGSASAVSLGATIDATTQAVVDTGLTGSVKAKLAGDSRLTGSDISVTTENNVVILTGKAPNAEAKKAAEDIALSAKAGVKVDNRIETPSLLSNVKADTKMAVETTGEVITDSWITTKVKSQLLADTLTKGTRMKVVTRNNVVTLRGKVATQAEKDQAIKLASEIKGVTRVNASKLRVSANVKAKANGNASVN